MASSLSSPFEIKCSHPVQPSSSFDSLFFEYLSTVRGKKFPRKPLSSRESPLHTFRVTFILVVGPILIVETKWPNNRRSRDFRVICKVSFLFKRRKRNGDSFADFPTYIYKSSRSVIPSSLSCSLFFLVRPSPSDVRSPSMVTRARTRKIFTG